MKRMSRIYFNPVTKEFELEGSEEFIRTYFDKLQKMLPGIPDEIKEVPTAAKAFPVKRTTVKKAAKSKIPAPKKVARTVKGKTLIDTVIDLIEDSPTGITTSELGEKTGFTAKQIRSLTSRAAKLGKIKRANRGTYRAIG